MVGRKMLQILEERNIKMSELIPVGSSKSAGSMVQFQGQSLSVTTIDQALEKGVDVAIFSAGGDVSKEWAPRFAQDQCYVIDNSSAWRMDKSCPLVIPEVNAHSISKDSYIIANPNCSTIQMLVALKPLQDVYGIKRVVVSTYQSITGTGKAAVEQMNDERAGKQAKKVYPYQIDQNCLPHCDIFLENDYTKEEMKLVNETRKILQDDSIGVTATAVRVPVMGGHSEAINVELKKEFEISDIKEQLSKMPGLTILDNPKAEQYPMPFYQKDQDDVFVGRIRRDESQEKTLNMWVVADNLRKGAATNAVQILEYLIAQQFV